MPEVPVPEVSTPTAVGFEQVTAGYGSLTILNGLSFAAREREITLLIGPNGAGKSTALKTLFGLVRPRSGVIRLRGEAVTGAAPAAMLRRGVAFVPQGRTLFGGLSLRHNLELGAVTVAKAERAERMEAVLARFPQIRARLDSLASSLSGGEQKQLEIGRALLLQPSVLLIDEPSIGLSPVVSRDVFRLLRALADGGVTVLMVEQNVRSALQVADRVLLLEAGHVAMDTAAAGLLNDPDLNRVFLGRPARDIIEGEERA